MTRHLLAPGILKSDPAHRICVAIEHDPRTDTLEVLVLTENPSRPNAKVAHVWAPAGDFLPL
jgi:hypothetical protein